MLLVASETVNRTAISCFFYLIANGWGILHFDFDPMHATNVARFLGLAYISHSSYFVTFGAFTVHRYIRFILIAFYSYLAYKFTETTRRKLNLIAEREAYLREVNMMP